MAWDPNNPAAYFSDINNLSPNYTNDPKASAAHLADMQAALSWAQANPTAPEAQYFAQELQKSMGEQTNINQYLGAQNGITDATKQLGQATDWLNKYSNDQAGQLQWAKDTGAYQDVMKQMPGGNMSSWDMVTLKATLPQWQAAYGGKQHEQWQATQNVNDAKNNFTTQQGNVKSGLTFAQPDYANQGKQLDKYWGDVNKTQVQPQVEDYYQTAYNNKNNIAEKMNMSGMLGSGAEVKAKGGQNANAIAKDTTLSNAYETQKAGSEAGLAKQQQQAKNAYKDMISGLQGNDLGKMLAGSANAASNAYNTNTATQLQTAMNNSQNAFQTVQRQNASDAGLAGDVFGLAGTIGGAFI